MTVITSALKEAQTDAVGDPKTQCDSAKYEGHTESVTAGTESGPRPFRVRASSSHGQPPEGEFFKAREGAFPNTTTSMSNTTTSTTKPAQPFRHLPRRPQELIDGMRDIIALMKVSRTVSRDHYYWRAISGIEGAIDEINACIMSERDEK